MGNKYVIHLLAFILVSCSVDEVFCAIHGERGSSITLDPHVRGELDKITWTHNGNNVVEYDQTQFHIFEAFKKRVVLNIQSGQLTIRKLKPEDSGVYESTAITSGKPLYSKHDVQIFDSVPQPIVTCKEESGESELATVVCSVDADTPVKYRWRGPTVYDHQGSELQLDRAKDADSVFICLVKNEVSEKQTSFSLRDCEPAGTSSGVIVAIVIAVVCLLLLVLLIPLLVCRIQEKKKLAKKTQVHGHVNVENGERRNLLSAGEATDEDTDEGGQRGKSKGLVRGVHRNPKRHSDLGDVENGTSFSLRATLPSQAKLRPRAGAEQKNGEATKDTSSPDQPTANGLQQEDERADMSHPVPVEVLIPEQKAPEDQSCAHLTESVPAVVTSFPPNSEDPDVKRDTVNGSTDEIVSEGLAFSSSPEDEVADTTSHHPNNVTGTTEGGERRSSLEDGENVSESGMDPGLTPDIALEEEKDQNGKLQTEAGSSQEDVEVKTEVLPVGEDNGTHVQQNHDLPEEKDDVKDEQLHSGQSVEDLTDVEQTVQKDPIEEAVKVDKRNEEADQDEDQIATEAKTTGKEEGSDEELEEEEREKKENITAVEHPPPEDEEKEKDVPISGVQEGGRSTGEHEIEGEEEVSETKHHDGKERESGAEQEGGVEDDTNQSEEDEKTPGQEQDESRQEDRLKLDEEMERASSKVEDQLLQQANEQPIGDHHVSRMDEMNDEESERKSQSKAQEEDEEEDLNSLQKEEDDHRIPAEESPSLEQQGSPDIKIDQPVRATDTGIDQDHELKAEDDSTENNIEQEMKNEDEKVVQEEEEQSLLATQPVELMEEARKSPTDQRCDKDDDGEEEEKTQEDHGQDEHTATNNKDVSEKSDVPAPMKDEEEKNTTGVISEDEALEPEKRDEEMTAVVTNTEPQRESNQEEQERQTPELVKPASDEEEDGKQLSLPTQDKDHKNLNDEESEKEELNDANRPAGHEAGESDKTDEDKSAVSTPKNVSSQEQDTREPVEPLSDAEQDTGSKPQVEDHKLPDDTETERTAGHEDVPEKKDDRIMSVNEPQSQQAESPGNEKGDEEMTGVVTDTEPQRETNQEEQERETPELVKPASDEEEDWEQLSLPTQDKDHKNLNDEEGEKEEPSVQLQGEAPVEVKGEEQKGQADSVQIQDQPLTQESVEKLKDTNTGDRDMDEDLAQDKTEGDAEMDEDREVVKETAQSNTDQVQGKADPLEPDAQGKTEGGAEIDEDTEVVKEPAKSNIDKVQGKGDPPVPDAKSSAADEQEHDVAEKAGNLCDSETPAPAQDKASEKRQEDAQKDGQQQDDENNCNSDENKVSVDQDDEIKWNQEPDKTQSAEESEDTGLQLRQTEQNHVDTQENEGSPHEKEQPPNQKVDQEQAPQPPSGSSSVSDGENGNEIVEPEQNEEKSASSVEKEDKGRKHEERKSAEMNEENTDQSRAEKVKEASEYGKN